MRLRLLAPLAALAASAATAAEPAAVTATKGENNTVEFKVGGATVAKYHAGPAVAKPFLYPVVAPNGAAVTRAWPMETGKPAETVDHVHQKSVWFCHGDVIPEGIELKIKTADKHGKGVDFWSETKDKETGAAKHGKIVCTKVGEPKQVAPNHAAVVTHNEWVSPDGVKILDEDRTVHLISLPNGRLFVFDIDLHATACPISFGDTKEGSFGVRVNDAFREANKAGPGVLANAEGKAGEKAVWGLPSAWCDYSGTADGKAAGVALFSDPKNPPASWHARGYGLMAANPFGREGSGFPSQKGNTSLLKIAKGDHLKLRYGVYAHDGDTAAGKVAEAFEAFKAAK